MPALKNKHCQYISNNEIKITFDGKSCRALEGDTIASALIRNDIKLIGDELFKLTKSKHIISFGDSHGRIFSNHRFIKHFPLSAPTAYNINNPNSSSGSHKLIINTLTNFEPRIRLNEVIVKAQPDNNQFDVQIQYYIIGIDLPLQQLTFALEPTR